MTVTTSYYTDTWHGSFDGSAEDLTVLLSRATDVINNAIFMSGYTVDTALQIWSESISKAICAQADYIDQLGGVTVMADDNFSSISLGKFSYSSGSLSSGSANSICSQSEKYLIPTGLLYRGAAII